MQEIKHRGLGEHGFGNAVTLGAGPFLRSLRCLQVGAEVARALDDLSSLRQALRLEGVGSSRVDLQACKLEYSIVSPK